MKTFILLLSFFLFSKIGICQIPVTDVTANTQLGILTSELATLNGAMAKNLASSIDNKSENLLHRLLGEKNLAFIQQVEDYMWQADEFLKKGREIQMIYNKEEDILKKLRRIKNNTPSFQNFENSEHILKEFTQNITSVISNVSAMVDDAQTILGKDKVRMSSEERRAFLKEILSNLILVEMKLDRILHKQNMSTVMQKNIIERDQYEESLHQSMRNFLNKKSNK